LHWFSAILHLNFDVNLINKAMENSVLNSPEWCELIFEGKNHAYGAYELRMHNARRQLIAVTAAALFFTAAALTPMLLQRYSTDTDNPDKNGIIDIQTYTIDPPKVIPPETKVKSDATARQFNTIANVVPHIVNTEIPDDNVLPTQNQLLIDNRLIGSRSTDGGNSGYGEIPLTQTSANVMVTDTNTYIDVPQMPAFPGGEQAMFRFLSANIKYPSLARELNISGIVYACFTINNSGKVENIIIRRGIGGGCDEEAARVISRMPDWMPGKQNGNAVKVRLNMPINFVLN
jgi:periplasmic protein TonB